MSSRVPLRPRSCPVKASVFRNIHRDRRWMMIALTWSLVTLVASAARSQAPGFVIPRAETGADRWLSEHPEWDGRGIIVAVFDSGVDPGAAGLQTTPDGRPKIIDLIDGTGGGDVRMSLVEGGKPEPHLIGLSGRLLTLPDECFEPDSRLHLGLKSGDQLFPREALARWREDRHRKLELASHQVAADLRIQLSETAVPALDSAQRKELEQRLKQLEKVASQASDDSPVFDCVTYFARGHWRAIVDTDEDGDLNDEQVLATYRESRSVGVFPEPLHVHFTVNIANDGQDLSIVIPSNNHGTHVAGIIGAHVPGDPSQDGVAPGVQIVSVKIGDTRLGGMETGPAIERGIAAVLRNGCHLVNMSYGEPTGNPLAGRLTDRISQLVHEHGVVFVSSAINEGPALSTVGAPGGTTPGVIGVGAYLSSAMMKSMYATDDNSRSTAYRWTSRGPTEDGDLGVDLFAPGGAYAPVPRWTASGSERMNGTSMASPNACGSIALLLSGLQATNRSASPAGLLRALQAAARDLNEESPLTAGAGLLQIPETWQILNRMDDAQRQGLGFQISVSGDPHERGIHLRETWQQQQQTFRVNIKPRIRRQTTVAQRAEFHAHLDLHSDVDWISHGSSLHVSGGGQSLNVTVDPTRLAPGVHFGSVWATDHAAPGTGRVLQIPVTVVRTHPLSENRYQVSDLEVPAGAVSRHFIEVPRHAGQMRIALKNLRDSDVAGLMVQAMPVRPGTAFRHLAQMHYLTFAAGESREVQAVVSPGLVSEIALAQPWNQPQSGHYSLAVEFTGLDAPRQIEVPAQSTIESWTVQNPASETLRLDLSASVSHREWILAPAGNRLIPLKESRDQLPNEPTAYQLELKYQFQLSKPITVSPRLQSMQDLIYESTTGGYAWKIVDEQGRVHGWGDMFDHPTALPKGKYELFAELRGDSPQELERLQKARMVLSERLDSAIAVPLFRLPLDALAGSNSIRSLTLSGRERAELTLSSAGLHMRTDRALTSPQLSEDSARFTGTVAFKDAANPARDYDRIVLGITASVSAGSGNSNPQTAADSAVIRDDVVQAALLKQLREFPLDGKAAALHKLVQRYLEQYPKDIDARVAWLHWLDQPQHRKQHLPRILEAADDVLDKIPERKIRMLLTIRPRPDDKQAAQRKRHAEQQRDRLIDALYRKGRALGYRELPDVLAEHPLPDAAAHDKAFRETLAALATWVDLAEADYVLLAVRDARRDGKWGQALEMLNTAEATYGPNYWYVKKRRDIYESLGWSELQAREARRLIREFPERFERERSAKLGRR